MKKIAKRKQVICQNCGTPFSIYIETYEKLIKDGTPIFCSVNCATHNHNITEKLTIPQKTIVDNTENSFKFHYKEIVYSNTSIQMPISDIKAQWEKQKGLCQITSIPLKLSINLSSNTLDAPMLVKIDKAKDWVKNNIMWVCKPIGILINTFNDDIYKILEQLTRF